MITRRRDDDGPRSKWALSEAAYMRDGVLTRLVAARTIAARDEAFQELQDRLEDIYCSAYVRGLIDADTFLSSHSAGRCQLPQGNRTCVDRSGPACPSCALYLELHRTLASDEFRPTLDGRAWRQLDVRDFGIPELARWQ